MIYLDNAATSWPKPEVVYQTMDKFLREKGGNPGRGSHSLAAAAGEAIEESRTLVSRFVNSPEINRIVFTLNCTTSLNLALKGCLNPGDHVVISALEHNSVMRPLNKLARKGITYDRLAPSPSTGYVLPEHIESAIKPSTRLIVMTHASNVTGIIQPVEDYGKIARSRGIYLLVDAAQTAGHYPVDVQASHIDLLAFSGHKGTFGPPGVGVLYIGERVVLDTLCEGGTGSVSEIEEQPADLPYRYQCGTQNSVGIAGLGAGIKYLNNLGLESVRVHGLELTRQLIEGLSRMERVKVYPVAVTERRAPVVAFNIQGYAPSEVGAILDQSFDIKARTGLHCNPSSHKTIGTFPTGSVRFSPGSLNTAGEIEEALVAVKKIASAKTSEHAK